MNKKTLVIVLILSHVLCVLFGFCIGKMYSCTQIVDANNEGKEIESVDNLTAEITEATLSPKVTDSTEEASSTEETLAETEETMPSQMPTDNPSETTPPATNPPATNPPATNPPATNPPATNPPATDPPATDPPATNPPATDPPATDPPATNPPATDPPATESGGLEDTENGAGWV